MKNKKKIISIMCLSLACTIAVTSLTGCTSKDSTDSKTDSSDKTTAGTGEKIKISYKNEKINLPEEIENVSSLSADSENIYITNTIYNYDQATGKDSNTTYFYTLAFDGTVVSKVDISPTLENENDSAYFNGWAIASDNTLWLIENHTISIINDDSAVSDTGDSGIAFAEESAVGADNPDTDYVKMSSATSMEATVTETAVEVEDDTVEVDTAAVEEVPVEETVSDYKYITYLRHIGTDGSDLLKIDMSQMKSLSSVIKSDGTGTGYISNLKADSEGNLFILWSDYNDNSSHLTAVDGNGNELYTIDSGTDMPTEGWSLGMFTGGDGKVYILRQEPGDDGQYGYVLYLCNGDTKKFEKAEGFSISNANNFDSPKDGKGDYLFYSYSSTVNAIIGYKADGSYDEIYNTTNNGLDVNYLDSFVPTDEGFIVGANSYTATSSSYNLYRIIKLDESEAKEKTAVNLAAYYLDDTIRSAVANYNDSDGDYVITVTDYSQYNNYSSDNEEDYSAGLTKLNAEISAGNIPDIMCMDYNSSFASKGLYLDLNTYIDGEDGLNRDEYQDFILKGLETDGKLYTIPVSFQIVGFAEKKEFVPEDGKLSADALDSILSANSEMTVMPSDTTRDSYLTSALNYCGNKFVNSETNECSFDSPEFIKILEDSAKYPEEIDYDNFDWTEYDAQYVTNKALSRGVYISSYDSLQWSLAELGGDASITGFPGLDENPIIYTNGNIMISSKSEYPDAGWQLIKSALSEENQNNLYNFPLNKAALAAQAQRTIDNQYYTDENGNKVLQDMTYYINNQEVKMDPIDQSMIDRINSLMEISTVVPYSYSSDTSFTDIINEEAAAYYAGTNTAETAAKNIQSRVSLYLSEQS